MARKAPGDNVLPDQFQTVAAVLASDWCQKTVFFWHQSEARTAATVWNWSGKTLFPGDLLAVLFFSSFHIYFSTRLDFPSPPLSASGSPRMDGPQFLLKFLELIYASRWAEIPLSAIVQ